MSLNVQLPTPIRLAFPYIAVLTDLVVPPTHPNVVAWRTFSVSPLRVESFLLYTVL